MKRYSLPSIFQFALIGVVMLLCIVSGYLYQQKKKYESQNRELIIQNDSIQAVNIELNNSLKLKSGKGQALINKKYK